MAVTAARLIGVADLGDAELESWQRLADRALEPNPFFEPGFVVPAARELGAGNAALLVAEAGGEWIGCLPAVRRRMWRGTPMRGTIGWVHLYCFLGTPLLDHDATDEAAAAVAAASVAARASGFLALPLMAVDGPTSTAVDVAVRDRGGARTALRSYERATLSRRDDPERYISLRSKHRREYRRLADRLAELLDAPLTVADEADSDAALDAFLALEASGWKGRNGTAFASIGHAALFREVCRRFRERGRLQLLVLRADGRALAAKCNFRAGDGLFCFKIGFDESLARYSPGIQLELANVRRFHEDLQLQWMDSCAEATNEMINRLWPDRRRIEIVAYTGGVRSAPTRATLLAARRARELTRRAKK
jgi:CelD/BcsL family acetyltransferase involved in cellulose biosynthesis